MVCLLLPVLLWKELKNIAYFSLFCMAMTITAVVMCMVLEIQIIQTREPKDKVETKDFTTIEQFLVFIATYLNLFEGNTTILNLYAEADKPQKFNTINLIVQMSIVSTVIVFAFLGYQAFGDNV